MAGGGGQALRGSSNGVGVGLGGKLKSPAERGRTRLVLELGEGR